jgi:hypothetical protein
VSERTNITITADQDYGPILDNEVAPLIAPGESRAATVQRLIDMFIAGDLVRPDQVGDNDAPLTHNAINQALDHVAGALSLALASAGVKMDRDLVSEAVHGAGTDTNPTAFGQFMLQFYREVESGRQAARSEQEERGKEQMDALIEGLEKIQERLERLEQATRQQHPEITIHNEPDADADSSSD